MSCFFLDCTTEFQPIVIKCGNPCVPQLGTTLPSPKTSSETSQARTASADSLLAGDPMQALPLDGELRKLINEKEVEVSRLREETLRTLEQQVGIRRTGASAGIGTSSEIRTGDCVRGVDIRKD